MPWPNPCPIDPDYEKALFYFNGETFSRLEWNMNPMKPMDELRKRHIWFIGLETKSCRILSRKLTVKYDRT